MTMKVYANDDDGKVHRTNEDKIRITSGALTAGTKCLSKGSGASLKVIKGENDKIKFVTRT